MKVGSASGSGRNKCGKYEPHSRKAGKGTTYEEKEMDQMVVYGLRASQLVQFRVRNLFLILTNGKKFKNTVIF